MTALEKQLPNGTVTRSIQCTLHSIDVIHPKMFAISKGAADAVKAEEGIIPRPLGVQTSPQPKSSIKKPKFGGPERVWD